MVATEENDSVDIKLDDDVEGDHIGSSDYCFVPVGEPVPIGPGDDTEFDSKSLPLKPLAVSEHFGLIFVAHSNGFFVAKTKEIIQLAKEIKEKKSGLSMRESCIVDIPIGKVYILALSADSSTLAASVAGDIHFFSVSSLLNKEQSPSFSSSPGDSSSVKDMQWTKRIGNHYVVLTNQGKLYYGDGQDTLKHVMDNVDAVEWSVKGKYLAVATNNVLSILSSKFKQKFSISLLFKLWVDDSEFDGTIKVDTIRWIRQDCIILGCFQLSADGTEENYLIQVVTSKHGKIADASSQPILLSFSDVFEGLIDDIVPFGSGPYMTLGYVDKCELAITANRKNTDQHIVLLGWPQENQKQVAVIDILRDTLRPKFSLQENGDDNIVLGLCLDKVSYNDKVEVVLGADYKELSPFCLLICLSLDGNISMFQVASATEVSALSEDASFLSEEEDDSPTAVFSDNGSSDSSSNSPTESVKQAYLSQSHEVKKKELYIGEGQFSHKVALEESPKSFTSKNTITDNVSEFSGIKQIHHTAGKQSNLSWKQGTDIRPSTPSGYYTASVEAAVGDFGKADTQERLGGNHSQSFPFKSSTNSFSQSTNLLPQSAGRTLTNENDSGREVPGKLGSATTLKATDDRKSFPVTSDGPSSFLSSSYSQPKSSMMTSSISNFPGGTFGGFSNVKSAAALSTAFSSSGKASHGGGQPPPFGTGTTEALPANRKSPMPFQTPTSANSSKDQRTADKDNNRITSTGRLLNSELRLSKQFGNVEEMIKELETLLKRIEGPGGYLEVCTVLLDSSVLELEEGMGSLFGRWRQWKSIMDEKLVEVQLLRDKTVQVAAKKFYMKGIIKQATDGQYWDLWNRQKLSPELELKRQHILKLNQELTSQLIELERHLNTLEIETFGEDRGQLRKRGFTSRFGSSRHGQSLRSLQEITSSQLAAAEQLSESLSRQMTLMSVESPTTKKQDARRELFEEIGIPYSNASFGSPEKKGAIDTPSNKVLVPSRYDDVINSSRRHQLRSLGSDSARRRRDSLDRSWASFEPPKTTVKREARRTPSVDRSSLVMEKEHVKFQVMERSAFARPQQQTTPATILPSSNDRGIWERTSNQGFETSSSLAQSYNDTPGLFPQSKSLLSTGTQAHQTTEFAKRLTEQTFSLSKSTNEISTLKDGPNTSSLFSQSRGFKSTTSPLLAVSSPNLSSEGFQSDNTANKSKSQSGLFASSSTFPFSILGSSSSLSSSLSVPSTSPIPSGSHLPPAVLMNKSSSSTGGNNVTQTVLPLQSSVSSPTVFKGSSFTLNSSFLVPSTSPTPSTAPLSPAILSSNSLSSFKAGTTDSKTILPSRSSVFPLLSGSKSAFKVSEKTVPSTILPCESLKKEPQPSKPEVSSKVEENTALQASSRKPESALNLETSTPSFAPTSEVSNLSQSLSNPSLSSTAPAVPDASHSGLGQTTTKDFLSPAVLPASEIGETENQYVMAAQEDDMEEEAPETSLTNQLYLGGLGGFGLGSAVNSTPPKQNPFGSTFANVIPTPVSSPMSVPTGELFRPPSFSYQSPTTQAPLQPTGFGTFSGDFGIGNTVQAPAGGGFGQPSKVGAGQQALGSVLGSFGQSRQFGNIQPVATSPVGFDGSSGSSPSSGGFAGIASGGGGFASLASAGGGFGAAGGGGFAGAASPSVGGFGGVASPSVGGFGGVASPSVGGFSGVASAAGGFGGAASSGGGGFVGAAPGGGFGAFDSQGGGEFSSFGNSAGSTGRPPSSLFTQMRK